MNKVELMGRLVENVEILQSKSGKKYGKFTLAVNRKFDKEKTDFINCIAFEKQAETLLKYVEKGNRIIVEGELNIDNYVNKDGNNVYTTTIKVNDFYFVDFKKEMSK